MPVTPVDPTDATSLAPGKYTKTVILNRIFDLIIAMLQSLQSTAIAQANRLTFDTQWQTAYTNVMNQVHVFQKNSSDSSNLVGDDTDRAGLNQLNSQFTTALQNRRSLISDDAKTLQSNVNQTNDAVNQQSTLGTSILQEISTMLSTIFK